MSQELHNQAAKAHQEGNIEKAKRLYIQALKVTPNVGESWNNLGTIYRNDKELLAAFICAKKALGLDPNNPTYLINIGLLEWEFHQYDECEKHLKKSIQINPNLTPVPWHTLAYLKWIRNEDPMPEMEKTISFNPNAPELIWDRGLIHLSMGNYEQGWKDYEARFANPVFKYLEMIKIPMWTGEDLSNKKLYLHAEQGLGDIIQIVRYVHDLIPMVGKIRFDVPYHLKRLFEHTFKDSGIEFKIMYKDPLPEDCDYHLPLGSLPYRLGLTFEQLSGKPYLSVPDNGIPINRKSTNKAVGIIWSGDKKHPNDSQRSANLADFLEMLSVPGIDLYSLQFGDRSADIALCGATGLIPDFSSQIRDMGDNASIMKQLDCVVTVDTASAHLAGAIGVPFHVITPYHQTDWRWMLERSDSPWYDSGTVHRQAKGENYRPVLKRVAETILKENN